MELARPIMPEEVVDHFDIVGFKEDKKEERLDLYLDEKHVEPEAGCESKGFRDAQVINYFPMQWDATFDFQ